MNTNKTLWFDAERTQYYLIPDTQVLPDGDLALHTLMGRECHVEAETVASWLVTQADAETHLSSSAMGLFMNATKTFAGLLSSLTPPQSQESSANDYLTNTVLAKFLGISPEELQNNPHLGQAGLQKIFASLADILADTIAEDPERLDNAREQIKNFRETLATQEVYIHNQIEDLPDKVHAWYTQSANKGVFHQIETLLRNTADKAQHSDPDAPLDIQTLLTELSKGLNHIFSSKEETPEAQQERYRKMARESIEATWGEKTPTFDFRKLWEEHNKNKG